ncbi:MAG: tyrosine-type recombinase/integrase [Bacteriovoracia bacterium]
MAISKYVENDTEYFKVYVHVRSSIDRSKRSQKYAYRLKTETEARREEKKLLQQATREVQKMEGLGLLWSEVVHLWSLEFLSGLLVKRVAKRSSKEYVGVVHKWTATWMNKPAFELSRADGRDLILRMERANLSRNYQKKVKNIINSLFQWGVEFGHIKENATSPLKGLLIDNDEERVPEILTLEEIKRFLTAAKLLNHQWYPIWSFAILTGMRTGELHALTWGQIDLEKEIILVDRSYDSNMKQTGPTKGRYWRTVPINSSLRNLILEIKRDRDIPKSEFVLPRIKEWDNGDQAVSLKTFLKSLNIKPVRFHALRACFATQMLSNGVPAPVVMKIGGWKRTSTMDIYLRLAGVDTKGATESLQFTPQNINFGDNVINILNKGRL